MRQVMAFAKLSCARHAGNVPRAPENLRHICLFLLLFWVKPALLAQTQVETLTINTNFPHSEFLVENCSSSKGRRLWNFGRVFIFSFIF
ncbi:hypothetical protein MTR_3g050830 [Medicago truncatula]|uniref:Transmembrane protein n=1 Tax=Medicago truncatula TaxID=3880 RepID=G7J1Z6_MEDTR|nr:hypothetical protein MTR_3g050830 [Medicago truncatula]